MKKKTLRIIAIILILSPWIYLSSVIKDIVFIILGLILFVTTINFKKSKN
jgi:hypothetical protein